MKVCHIFFYTVYRLIINKRAILALISLTFVNWVKVLLAILIENQPRIIEVSMKSDNWLKSSRLLKVYT